MPNLISQQEQKIKVVFSVAQVLLVILSFVIYLILITVVGYVNETIRKDF
jgi:hypothetical protein